MSRSVPSDKPRLHVRLLGVPQLVWRGKALDVPRRQVRALLYRLAAQREPVPREQLCFLFWADRPDVEARRRLSRLLTHLSRALPDASLLIRSVDRVGLDPRRVCSDCIAFAQLSDLGRRASSLNRAAELYRGPFLDGLSIRDCPEFQAWVLEQQRVYEGIYLGVLKALVDRHAARDEHDLAIACAKRLLTIDELAEDVHRRLISLYGAAGNRAAAVRQFERCVAILERELSVRPMPETRAVYQTTLESRGPSTADRGRELLWATLPSLDVPLVGREAAFQELRNAFKDVKAGSFRLILISGEAGIGKSRLMEAFATAVTDQAVVLAAAARPALASLPYQPVAEALRSIPDLTSLASAVPPVWIAEATRLLPELRDLQPDLSPPPGAPEEARTRLLEALCRLMLGLVRGRRPILLCLDDLHCADSATLDWLVCLARRLSPAIRQHCALLVVGTYRSEDRARVRELRQHLLRLGKLSELHLKGLSVASVRRIVSRLAEPGPDAGALARRLHLVTGGNPFFLLETLRALLEAGRLSEHVSAPMEVPVPDTVREAIEARLQRLDRGARQMLEAGAVLGMSFEFQLVRRTAGRGEMEAIKGLDEAVGRQILVELPSGYRFRHSLIHQTVEASLGPVRRRLLHRRAARALKLIAPEATNPIARHDELGGAAEMGLRHRVRAAELAEELFAWQEVEEVHSRMLALMDDRDPVRQSSA